MEDLLSFLFSHSFPLRGEINSISHGAREKGFHSHFCSSALATPATPTTAMVDNVAAGRNKNPFNGRSSLFQSRWLQKRQQQRIRLPFTDPPSHLLMFTSSPSCSSLKGSSQLQPLFFLTPLPSFSPSWDIISAIIVAVSTSRFSETVKQLKTSRA